MSRDIIKSGWKVLPGGSGGVSTHFPISERKCVLQGKTGVPKCVSGYKKV